MAYVASMEMISLKCEEALNASIVGGKAANLARMIQAGIPVPAGFVIPSQLTNQLLRRSVSLEEFQRAIQTQIAKEKITSAAVRSSGALEDSNSSSFAGAYSTFLNCNTIEEIIHAVKACWESSYSERVHTYRELLNLNAVDHAISPESVSVIVQQMISVKKGGVIFTRNPYGSTDEMLLQGLQGGCNDIVSGKPQDVTIFYDRRTKSVRDVVHTNSSSNQFGNNVNELREQTLLLQREITTLFEYGLQIEALFGQAQDIEWGIAYGQIWILQARPLRIV